MAPFFFFDFTLDKSAMPPVEDIPEQVFIKPAQRAEQTNLCPYPIPKIDGIVKDIDSCTYQVDKHKFVSDLFECGAIAISEQVDRFNRDEREERYMQIIKNYKPAQQKSLAEIFAKIYALLSSVVYDNGVFNDYLGEIFMRCNLGRKAAGQFFTPYNVSSLMARCLLDSDRLKKKAEKGKIISINDPACGGGGMLIAALEVLRSFGINYARDCFIEANDIDIRCVHMTYLQLSLAGAPAIVRHQDTFSRDCWSVWYTPAYLFQYLRFHKFDNPYDNPKFQQRRQQL